MYRLTTPHPGGIDMLGMPLIGTYDVDMTLGYPAARVKCTLGRYEDTGLTPDEVEAMIAENTRLRAELEAAKRDLKLCDSCDVCEHYEKGRTDLCQVCEWVNSKWEWRGLCAENGGV